MLKFLGLLELLFERGTVVLKFGKNIIFKVKSSGLLQYLRNSSYLTEDQWDISDLPFVRNKDYIY